MKQKRRIDTDTNYAGTPTGTETFTVTFYPQTTAMPADAEVVAHLQGLAQVKRANSWLHDAAVFYWNYLKGVPAQPVPMQQPNRVVKEGLDEAPAHVVEGVSTKVRETMGLKFGKKT